MSFYNRWQSVDFIKTISDFSQETLEQPWSKGGAIVLMQVMYFVSLFLIVKLLRRDSSREE